jgi:hypothetical protein
VLRKLCLIAIVALLFPGFASAIELYVDNELGSDDLDGRSLAMTAALHAGPLRTITRALQIAHAGDRIHLTNNRTPYRESVTIFSGNNGVGVGGPFTIEGNGATLSGSFPVPRKAWENYRGDIFRFTPEHAAFGQLFLDARPAKRRYLARPEAIPNLNPLEWCLSDGMIYFRVDSDKLPDEYPLTYAAQTVGITLYQVRGVLIRDLIVEGFQLDGINAHDRATECVLDGVIARGNGRAGVAVGGASEVRLINCLLGDNGDAQLLTDGPSKTFVRSSRLLDNTAPPLLRRGGEVWEEGEPDAKTPESEAPAAEETKAKKSAVR